MGYFRFRKAYSTSVKLQGPNDIVPAMQRPDVICPKCHAGYRRIELASRKGRKGEHRCLFCDHVLEVFDGSAYVAIRLTVQPEKPFD
jgi:hypothetical protein